ncbi:MAG: CtkA family protein [Defluviitaleaceae bacterium]|nr:CtkA family protein [Defluviitaleaceae bacterium]
MIADFNDLPTAKGMFYGGNAGAKDAVIYDGHYWMIKYPKTTRDLTDPQISYTTSPLSEYLGSKIYEILAIPVHKTILGTRKNKIVVACKDFLTGPQQKTPTHRLIPFHDLKNSFMSSDLESYSGTGSETLLDEVLATINNQEDLKSNPDVKSRFWDMFVTDAFIGNNDRNNGNWGILWDTDGKATLAPVYDNGNAFFNKRSIKQMESRLTDDNAMHEDAYKTLTCAYKHTGLDNEGHHINPFKFIEEGSNEDCTAAVSRFLKNADMKKIKALIQKIPESTGTLAVMPDIQKRFYIKLLEIRYNHLRRYT